MNKLIIPFFRDIKQCIIYILLFIVAILIIAFLKAITCYYNYTINFVLGTDPENRGYNVYVSDEQIIKDIKNKFNLSKVEKITENSVDSFYYYIVLNYYQDTEKFNNYMVDKNINFYLADCSKIQDITLLQKNIKIYNWIRIIGLVFLIFIINNIIRMIYNSELKNFALLKLCGYKNKYITNFMFIFIFALLFFSSISTIIIGYLFKFSTIFLNDNNLSGFLKYVKIFPLCFDGILISFCLIIFNYLKYKRKIKKINIFEILSIE